MNAVRIHRLRAGVNPTVVRPAFSAHAGLELDGEPDVLFAA